MDCVKYGVTTLPIPEKLLAKAHWLVPKDEPSELRNLSSSIKEALNSPIGSRSLKEQVMIGDKVSIVVSDITRPVPTAQILPALLEELHTCGIVADDICIVFALGIHRGMTDEEKAKVLGSEIFSQYKNIEPEQITYLGETSRGTPIEVCKEVADSDFIILTGNIEFHYFAGYSGGYKALMPGVSTKAAIQNNHKMMLDPKAKIGVADGNPVREDLEEFGQKFPRTFLLNVVLNSKKEITKVVAGDPILAHREGCRVFDEYYKVYVNKPADLVIVSAGGYPKDINMYQAQKALDNAAKVVKKGGKMVLVAEMKEYFGEETFEEWLLDSQTIGSIISKIKENFVLGGHKAAAIANLLKDVHIYVLSSMDEVTVKKAFFTPLKELSDLENEDFKTVYVIPYGGLTLPEVRTEKGREITLEGFVSNPITSNLNF
ncbi:MAG: hypothetical protein APF84_10900 [Gracilibacter sp. BRH_c7a]|nr:MAG: hypothetical protein APF84_10900 [Gracilibacter sp. BRH_c7a]